jgi:2-(1,2-epoxy-1,2-dihydrophenyl)acetyl-CoA isomerase
MHHVQYKTTFARESLMPIASGKSSLEAPVLVSINGATATIALNRPERLNALTEPMLLALASALEHAAGDDAVRVVLLKGEGRAFCAGQDLSDRDPRLHPEPFDLEAIQKRLFHPVVRTMKEMDKPVVAAVSGVAAGAGAAIALAADIVVAADEARLALSFSKVGLSVDAGAGFALVRSLGAARTRGLLLTGGALSGAEAAQAGLIFKSVPDSQLAEEVDRLTASLASGPTIAYGAIKRAVRAAETGEYDAYLAKEASLQGRAGASDDYREGVLAFLEKRAPHFEGR